MMGEKRPGNTGPGTIVGANVKLVGTLQDASDIVVHGRIEGEVISSQSITITETAYIKGPISAEIIAVAGKVNGSITATGKLEILPTGKVFGSITSKDLSIRSGAIFVGKCTMPEGEKEAIADAKEAPKDAPKGEADYEVE
jgi:cytoskeletal protein CcmA (bactofilin family)